MFGFLGSISFASGANPSRIIFANPCKAVSELLYAKEVGVDLMTFDNGEVDPVL